MQVGIKKWIFSICVALLTITSCIHIGYKQNVNALESSNRTEIYAPNEYNIAPSSDSGYVKIYENHNFEYYYSSQKTILKILNKKTGFLWSTGADTDSDDMINKKCSGIKKYSQEYYACAIDLGPQRNGRTSLSSYAEINGLVAFSYLNMLSGNYRANRSVSSIFALMENTTYELYGHNKYANEWMFKMSYVKTASSGGGTTSAPSTSDSSQATSDSGQSNSETSSSDSTSANESETSSVSDAIDNSNSSSAEEVPLNVNFEVFINMRLTFTEDGLDVHIYDDDISGSSKDSIEAVYPLPLLGQSGGKMIQCRIPSVNEEGIGDCSFALNAGAQIVDNPKTNLDGYIFVPDGSGALIRFDNVKYYEARKTIYFDMYKDPYRSHYTTNEFASSTITQQPDYIETKHISMPVWGVSYGNNQDAFVAYVTSGSEYFGLEFEGRSTEKEYSKIMPRFEKNRLYNYTFGSGTSASYMLSPQQKPKYDVGLSYCFLHGDGSDDGYAANYVGMALKYRDYIQKNHLVKEDVTLNVGPKIDFLMSDTKEGIFSMSDVNVTSTNDVVDILNDLHHDGIDYINSTLYGWQKGGISTGKPWKTKWNSGLGGKSGFKKIIKTAAEYGDDIYFYTDYSKINKTQSTTFNTYVVKTLGRQYGTYQLSDVNKPIQVWYYTNADMAGKWVNQHAKNFAKLGNNVGIQTGGISTSLVPDYAKDLSYAGAANSVYQSTKQAAQKVSLSGDTPNFYLWRNYDNFTNISVYNSQYHCETDSVPFMEIVLGGLVNLYAEYSNFSFYDAQSQLKMIEYNLNPSFIVSASENTNIMYTNARDWFSTAYSSYHSIINEICQKVLPELNKIQGKTIVDRDVVEFDDGSLGLYINTYASFDNGTIKDDKVVMAINYFDYDVNYEYNGKNYQIPALSALELK